jgi:hypothetical protein
MKIKTVILEVNTLNQPVSYTKLVTRINALTKRLIDLEAQQQAYWEHLLTTLK